MNLFSKSAAVELKEFKANYAKLEGEFNSYKEEHASFLAEKEALSTKLSTLETELSGLKEKEATLVSELAAKSSEVETLKANEKTVNEAAGIKLEKVGQPAIPAFPVTQAIVDVDQLWNEAAKIKDSLKRRAFYLKEIKGNK